MNKRHLVIYITFVSLFLISCAQVEKADYQTPLHISRDAHTPPLYFSGLKVDLPKAEDIGVVSHQNRFCGFPYQPVDQSFLRGETTKAELQEIFENALEPIGYDVVSAPTSYFFEEEAENEILRTEFKIGAKLIDIDLSACAQQGALGFFGYQREGVKGELNAVYEWSVFDNIRKTTLYKTTTMGYAKRRDIHPEGLSLMIYDSFEMAAYNLASDQKLHALMVYGQIPEKTFEENIKDIDDRVRVFDPDEEVYVLPQKLSSKLDLQKAINNTVMVQAGAGHASGFFITKQGHILTNAHAVGDAQRVRIVTSDKKHKLSAEILRTDKVRDTALLRLEAIPNDLKIAPFPVHVRWPKIGSDIYVIGAPINQRLQDTVTKGIISAHRKDFKMFGQTLDYLQADVAIQGGNSGGPLIDSQGNLVGMAVAGVGLSNESLNYFIPIENVFMSLNIVK